MYSSRRALGQIVEQFLVACPVSLRMRVLHFEVMAVGSSAGGGCSSKVKWLTDLEKSAIVSNFEKRGWVKGSLEGNCACTRGFHWC